MRRATPLLLLAAALHAPVALAEISPAGTSQGDHDAAAERRPSVEVAFVLDTTGSMSSLIEGAKQTIWQIANDIVGREPTPQVRFGLVGYRDRGDDYITRKHDLSADLDAVYGHLTAFEAGGGGDGPESVNQALHEAVHKLSWSDDPNVLKIIFLIGDAPPHMDYEQDIAYHTTCEQAVRSNLIINTIQCGIDAEATRVWREIAGLSEGTYASIQQSGGVRVVATPMDGKLAELARQLRATVTPYGDREVQAQVVEKLEVAGASAAPAAADRMSYLGRAASEAVVTGDGDLTAEFASGRMDGDDMAELDRQELPEAMREMTPQQREAYLRDQVDRRRKIQAQVAELTKQREAYLREQRAATAQSGEVDGFDRQVMQMIGEQMERHRRAQE